MRFVAPKYMSTRYMKRFAWFPVTLAVRDDYHDRSAIVWFEWYYVKQFYGRYGWRNHYLVTKEEYDAHVDTK